MQDHDAVAQTVGGTAVANAAARASKHGAGPRRWSVEEKIRIAQESLATEEPVASVARRYGISRCRRSSRRCLVRRVSWRRARHQPGGVLPAVAVDERNSVSIEGAGVTVRLDGAMAPSGIAATAVALVEVRRWSG